MTHTRLTRAGARATVTKALKEAEELRLVHNSYRSQDASTVYELTEDGKS